MRVAVYTRVSTDRQDTAAQLPALERLCDARGWIDRDVFSETESGTKARPVLDDLCDRAKRGQYGAIVVWALDRLGRNMYDVIDRVRALDTAHVRVASYCEPWLDTGGPARDLLLSIFAWVGQQERNRLRERTCAGLARARAKGRRLGRPPVADPAAVCALRAQGCSWAVIARELGCTVAAARGAAERATRLAENGGPNRAPPSDGEEIAK